MPDLSRVGAAAARGSRATPDPSEGGGGPEGAGRRLIWEEVEQRRRPEAAGQHRIRARWR